MWLAAAAAMDYKVARICSTAPATDEGSLTELDTSFVAHGADGTKESPPYDSSHAPSNVNF